METIHGKWNLNLQLRNTPYYVVEYDNGFVIENLYENVEAETILPVRIIENNTYCYYCCESEHLYSQQDINKFFNIEKYSVYPIETTPVIATDSFMGEELVEEFDVLEMII